MATHTLPPDAERVLTGFVRGLLAGTKWRAALVSNRLEARPSGDEIPPAEAWAVIVRSDGGPALEPPTHLRRFGIRVIGPDGDDNHHQTGELARYLAAAMWAAPQHTQEVAAVRAVNGPMRVPPATTRPEMYLTAELVLVGQPITF